MKKISRKNNFKSDNNLILISNTLNELNLPITRYRVVIWIKKKTHLYSSYQRLTQKQGQRKTENIGMEKYILYKAGIAIYVSKTFLKYNNKRQKKVITYNKGVKPARRYYIYKYIYI